MAEIPGEVPITSDDDSEQELSSQLQEVDSRSGGWSSWSEWSSCSRSCDGGVSHQLRTCRTGSCRGDHVRYKICNMQSIRPEGSTALLLKESCPSTFVKIEVGIFTAIASLL
ncbi:hypothetical protein MTP99_001110 [Tenebrio molitor]|nr:hypothetical protein MTP99_001110 [Tenebrio molitor]